MSLVTYDLSDSDSEFLEDVNECKRPKFTNVSFNPHLSPTKLHNSTLSSHFNNDVLEASNISQTQITSAESRLDKVNDPMERNAIHGVEDTNKKIGINFFGLSNESSDSDPDDVGSNEPLTKDTASPLKRSLLKETNPVKECNDESITVENKPLIGPYNLVTNPTSNDTHSEDSEIIRDDLSSIGFSTVRPKSSFWSGNANVSYKWTSRETDNLAQNLNIMRADNKEHVHVKRQKIQSESKPVKAKSLMKTCFYVHHVIKPYLHQNIVNKVAKNKNISFQAHDTAVNRIKWGYSQYSHLILSTSMDRSVKVWNAFTNQSIQALQEFYHHEKAVRDAEWCSGGRQILTASYDCTCKLLDVETGKLVQSYPQPGFATCVKMHPVSSNIFAVGSNSCIHSWDIRGPTKPIKKYSYKDTFGQVQDLVFLHNGREFLTCNDFVNKESADRNIMAWDFSSGVLLSNQIYQERFTCTRLKIHPSNAEFIAQSQGNYIALFSTIRPYKMNKCKRFEGHKIEGYNIGCDFSHDGNFVYSGSADGQIYVYNYNHGKVIKKLILGRNEVCMDIACHPVLPSVVACASWSGSVVTWH